MVTSIPNHLPTIYRTISQGDNMNITAMTKDWQKEGKGIAITSRSISNVIRGYDQNDIDNMLKQIDSGISQTQAAKNNNIPRGSVANLLPKT